MKRNFRPWSKCGSPTTNQKLFKRGSFENWTKLR